MIGRTLFVLLVMIGEKAERAQISAEADFGESDPSSISSICTHRIIKASNRAKVKIGEHLTHRWNCSEEYGPNRYSLFVRNCDQIEKNGQRTILADKFGCTSPNASSAAHFSLNNLLSSAQQNANNSVLLLTVFGYSQLLSRPHEGVFRIECILSLLPKGPNTTKFPNCSQNLMDREKALNKLFTPTMAHQKRFIDMVETNVSSEWIQVENEQNNRQTLAQNFGQEKKKGIGKEQRRPFEIWHDQMPISSESEEMSAMALSPFLERAFSIFATSVSFPTPPTSAASFSQSVTETNETQQQSVQSPIMPNSSNLSTVSIITVNPTTVFSTDLPTVNSAVTKSFSPAPPSFSPPHFELGSHRVNTTRKLTAEKEKKDENNGNAFTEKMGETIQNSTNSSWSFYVPLNSNSPLFHNLSSRQCSWTMLNTSLLIWSIFSTLHWLCLLTAKLRSSVVIRRRMKISPKQKIAVAKMSAMKRKMMRPKKHCGGIRQRKNLIEYPDTSVKSDRNPPAQKIRDQQRALRTVRQRHLLHRTILGGGMAPIGTIQQGKTAQQIKQKKQLSISAVGNRGGQKAKNGHGHRLVSNLGRICEEEEEEGKRENQRQKLVIGGRRSEEMTDGREGKSGKATEKTAFWDGWTHRETQMEDKIGREAKQRAEIMFKFF